MNYLSQKTVRQSAPFAAVRRNGRMCLMTLRTGTKTPKVSNHSKKVVVPLNIRPTSPEENLYLVFKRIHALCWMKARQYDRR